MLDLAKPIGSVEELVLYGDHENPDLVYYLPDEVDLARLDGAPDLALQIFFEDAAVVGSGNGLDGSVGAILGLGARCTVSPERLDDARRRLRSELGRPDVALVQPPWERGRVDLLLLDAQTSATGDGDAREDALVSDVLGSRAPSLSDGELAALFHARVDRRGAALLVASLEGRVGSLAGVLYDLEFYGLSPAVDLRMRADLDRVADAFSAGAGVNVYYVAADIKATCARLQEDGVIEMDLVSQVTDPETQRQVDETVQDFYEVLMRQLFRPTVPPIQELAGAAPSVQSASLVRFTFSYTHTESHRVIEVDYRKRMARRRTHNPQSHLAALRGIQSVEEVVQRVPLSRAWRELEVEVALPGGFADPDLRGVAVVLWRGADPVLAPEQAREGGLRMPENAGLAELAFSRDDAEPRHLSFVTEPDEPPFYRWQAKLTYAPSELVDSPLELWSEPRESRSRDLDLFPQVLATTRSLQAAVGAGHGEGLEAIVTDVAVRRNDGTLEASRRLRTTPEEPDAVWTVRRPEGMELTVEAQPELFYTGARSLRLPSRRLVDRELIVNTPFRRNVEITPLVASTRPDVLLVAFETTYEDEKSGYLDRRSFQLRPPGFVLATITVPVRRQGDEVAWKAEAVLTSGRSEEIDSGRTPGGTVVLDLAGGRVVRLQWLGGPLAEEDLRFVRVTLRARSSDGETVAEERVEWRAGGSLGEHEVVLPRGNPIEWRVEKRFTNGERQRGDFEPLLGDVLPITP